MVDTRKDVELRIMPSGEGRGWYWEVISAKNVIARGVADTERAARTAAHDAAREADLVDE
jgi:ribose 5-phosphate isomerase RpiB